MRSSSVHELQSRRNDETANTAEPSRWSIICLYWQMTHTPRVTAWIAISDAHTERERERESGAVLGLSDPCFRAWKGFRRQEALPLSHGEVARRMKTVNRVWCTISRTLELCPLLRLPFCASSLLAWFVSPSSFHATLIPSPSARPLTRRLVASEFAVDDSAQTERRDQRLSEYVDMDTKGCVCTEDMLQGARAPYPLRLHRQDLQQEHDQQKYIEYYFGPTSTLAAILLLFSVPCVAFVPFLSPCDTRVVATSASSPLNRANGSTDTGTGTGTGTDTDTLTTDIASAPGAGTRRDANKSGECECECD